MNGWDVFVSFQLAVPVRLSLILTRIFLPRESLALGTCPRKTTFVANEHSVHIRSYTE